jgi:hypothetical protein
MDRNPTKRFEYFATCAAVNSFSSRTFCVICAGLKPTDAIAYKYAQESTTPRETLALSMAAIASEANTAGG